MTLTTTAARQWPFLAALAETEARLAAHARRRGPAWAGAYESLRFGIKQGWACLFGGLLLGLIVASRLWYPAGALLARHDALVLAALAIQAMLLVLGMETVGEAKVILAFHLVGTVMEVFKTGVGSWIYPEPGMLRIGHVPLFTGFMYAAVGSYLFRVWRLFDFRFDRHPRPMALTVLSVAIYANFFADHWGFDARWLLIAAAIALFRSTVVHFKVWEVHRRMPLLLGFLLITLFIWFGENLGTAGHAWVYPNQARIWSMVSPAKLTSWFLLMLVSYTMVAIAMRVADVPVDEPDRARQPQKREDASREAGQGGRSPGCRSHDDMRIGVAHGSARPANVLAQIRRLRPLGAPWCSCSLPRAHGGRHRSGNRFARPS